MSLTNIANAMYATDPARDYYPLFLTNQEIIASFYLNVLGRPADAEGLAFWTAKLNAAGATPGSVITQMIDVVAHYTAMGGHDPAGLISEALFNNKVEVAQYYGEHNGNISDAAVALAGVTADHATVTAAIALINSGSIGQDGIDVTLTTAQDTINGTPAGDVVHGTFGTGAGVDTYTAGDTIDLGQGTIDQLNLTVTGIGAAPAISVKNTETINIQDTIGGTFNALLVENAPAINLTNTLAGQLSTVNNAALGSVMGLAGKGNLTVNYSGTSGKADEAKLSLNGVGTSDTVRSIVNVASGNTIEKVSIAAAGTNFVALTGGTAASTVTVTGAGTNNIDLSGAGNLAPLATVDASASTGTNAFVMGATLGGGDTIKGGTGADTVFSAFTAASLINPTLAGVETWTVGSYGAAAVMDLVNTDGLKTINVTTSAANMQVINADSSLTAFNLNKLTVANSTLKVGYDAASKGDLAVKIGTATSGIVDLGTVTLTNTKSVSIATVGAFAHDINDVNIAGAQTAVSVNVGAGSSLHADQITVTGNVDHASFTVGAGSYYSGGLYLSGNRTLGDVTVNVGAGGEFDGYQEITGKGNVGNVTLTATGNGALMTDYVYATNGDIGNVSINVNGNNASGLFGATASGGGFGDVSINVNGDNAMYGVYLSGGSGWGGATTETMGNVSMVVVGDTSESELYIHMSGGDVGNITYSVTGNTASGYGDINVASTYFTNAAGDSERVGGGNIGDLTLTIDGDSAGMGFYVYTSGGAMGNISITADHGGMFEGNFRTNDARWASGGGMQDNAGDIASLTIFVGDDSSVSGSVSAGGGDIGAVNITVNGANASGGFGIYATAASGGVYGNVVDGSGNDYAGGGNIGHVNVDINGADASYYLYVHASGGDIGGVDYSLAGNGASGYLELSAQRSASGSTGGDIGAVNINLASNTDAFELNMNFDGHAALTVVAGDNTTSGNFYISGGWNYDGTDSASLDSVNITYGQNANTWFEVGSLSGSVGAVTVSYGDNSSAGFAFSGITGSIGPFTGHFGSGQDFYMAVNDVTGSMGPTSLTFGGDAHFWIGLSGAMPSVGAFTIVGGDATSSGGISLSDTANPVAIFGGVDASAWLGEIYVDLEGVTLGTTVKVGADGSWVRGTEGGDNVFLGAGVDTFAFDATPTAVDTLFGFKTGTGGDVMDLIAAATSLKAAWTVDTAIVAASGDVLRLTDIAGGQDITTAAGLITALTAGGEYASVDEAASAAFTIVTSATATSSQLFVFNVVDTNANAVFDAGEVTLVGVVNASAASALSGLVAGNLA